MESAPTQLPVPHVVLHTDGSVRRIVGADFLAALRPTGSEYVMPMPVRHPNGACAIAWMDEEGIPKRMPENFLARAIFEFPDRVFGPVVCTGPADADGNVLPIPATFAAKIRERGRALQKLVEFDQNAVN